MSGRRQHHIAGQLATEGRAHVYSGGYITGLVSDACPPCSVVFFLPDSKLQLTRKKGLHRSLSCGCRTHAPRILCETPAQHSFGWQSLLFQHFENCDKGNDGNSEQFSLGSLLRDVP